jgi:hypothetical protein
MEKYMKQMFNVIDSEWIGSLYENKSERPDVSSLIKQLAGSSQESIVIKKLDYFFKELRKDYLIELSNRKEMTPELLKKADTQFLFAASQVLSFNELL